MSIGKSNFESDGKIDRKILIDTREGSTSESGGGRISGGGSAISG